MSVKLSSLCFVLVAVQGCAAIPAKQSLINGQSVAFVFPTNSVPVTNYYGILNTNATFGVILDNGQVSINGTNSAGVFIGSWGREAQLWATRLGAPSAAALALTGNSSGSSTSPLVFSLARSTDGVNYDTNSLFTFTITPSGNTITTTITNLPTWFLTGAQKARINSVIVNTNATLENYSITSLKLSGFIP
jgi:hypothetical protein